MALDLVSTGTAGQGNQYSTAPELSEDGRYVCFNSAATNLVSNDMNGQQDVFLRDTQSRVTHLVSATQTGATGNNSSNYCRVTASGTTVLFQSAADNLVASDGNGRADWFTWNLGVGVANRIMRQGGAEPIWDAARVSPDGRYLALRSETTSVLRDQNTGGEVPIALMAANGMPARVDPMQVGRDGSYVLFSYPEPFSGPAANGMNQLQVWYPGTGTYSAISAASNGTWSDNGVDGAGDASGAFFVFASVSQFLIVNDLNGGSDVFTKLPATGALDLISTGFAGGQGNGPSYSPSISSDGRYVAFCSGADNIVPNVLTHQVVQTYVIDLVSGRRVLVSANPAGEGGNSYSCGKISGNGQYVAIDSSASDLVAGDTNGTTDVFIAQLF